jgi:hypothetical protein
MVLLVLIVDPGGGASGVLIINKPFRLVHIYVVVIKSAPGTVWLVSQSAACPRNSTVRNEVLRTFWAVQ